MIPDAAGDAGKSGSLKVVRPANIAEAVRFALQAPDGASSTSAMGSAEVRSSM